MNANQDYVVLPFKQPISKIKQSKQNNQINVFIQNINIYLIISLPAILQLVFLKIDYCKKKN